MKTKIIALVALAIALSGCASLDSKLAGLSGLTLGTVSEQRNDPFGGGSFNAQGIVTDPKTGITTINIAQLRESYPMWGFSVSVTGVVLTPKTATASK